jgi:hypothetical protein
VAHDGRLASVNASPRYSQPTRSAERMIGIRCGSSSPSNSGSEVPNAYHQPSLPRITAGSAKVSAAGADTGLV